VKSDTGSKPFVQFIHADSCLAENGPQCSSVNLPVIGNNRLGERIIAAHDDVTAMLTPNREAGLLQSADDLSH